MIIYLDEDGSYLSWVTHHREGFVVDWLRKPTNRSAIVHRATCPKIRQSGSRKTHWTTGRHLKACSLDLAKLLEWIDRESDKPVAYCEDCHPQAEPSTEQPAAQAHFTKLEKSILDDVLESSVFHLDNLHLNYDLRVHDLAEGLGKTPRQIAAALYRLVQSGHLRLDDNIDTDAGIVGEHQVFPTIAALRLEPAFIDLSDAEITRELEGLANRSSGKSDQ